MRILNSLCLVTMLCALNAFALDNNQVDSSTTNAPNVEEGFHGGGGGGFHPGPAPSFGGGGFHPGPAPSFGGGGFHPGPAPSFGGGGYHPGPAPGFGGGGYHPGPAPGFGGGGYHPGPAPGFGGGGYHPGPAPGYGPVPPPYYYGGGFGPRPYPPFNRGGYPWPVWNHPAYDWPAYDWQWETLVSVTCTAVNSYGDEFPVTETGYAADEWQLNLAAIQEAALDQCYADSAGDESCQPLECTPAY